jgi:N-acyl-D-amino-acid deacylase
MARPLAAAGRPYVSHLRGYGPDVRSGLDELVAVGHAAGIRVHASHLWGEPADITAAFESADARGVSVTYDMYPYRRSSTILAMLLLPSDLQALGPGHTLAALTDPRQRAGLLAGEKFTAEFLRHVYLGCLPGSHAGLAGQSVTAAAAAAPVAGIASTGAASAAVPASAQHARTPGEWVLDLLVSTRLNAGAHLDRPGLTDGQLAWLASGDRQCGGSDGIYQGQHPHPRGYGAFATLAEHYLAAGSAAGYQHLARHLAANAADAYGLRKRGRLAPGMAADICVIGPGGITARASYDRPLEQAAGVSLVLVNGVVTWRYGQPVTTRHPGQVVST